MSALIIKRLIITGFLARNDPLSLEFHDDINIVTGYNGAGKTNLLKVIWYTMSGNIHALLEEVEFSSISMETSEYKIDLIKVNNHTCRGSFTAADREDSQIEDYFDEDAEQSFDARDTFRDILMSYGASLFFPTFRRIEGGFTTTRPEPRRNPLLFNAARPKSELSEALATISRRLSNNGHTFVTSLSTLDIAELLLRHFNEMSEEANSLQTKMSKDVIDRIRDFRRDTQFDKSEQVGSEAVDTIESIQTLIEGADQQRELVMAPLRAVQKVVSGIFRHKGIQLNRRVSFGDTVNAINSDLLSAGEKQMLSFICYNAFTDNAPIIIDEPELSLHVDWQRILFPTLLSQKKANQFIVATHSPFIYGKYPEKEIALVADRGGELDVNG